MYIEKVISKSKAGYIVWYGEKSRSAYGFEGYDLEDLLKKIPNAKVIPEDPPSLVPSNCIIMWGFK